MSDMKRFNALKRVNAHPMTRQEYNDYRGWTLPEDEDGSDEGYLTEDIDGPTNTDEHSGYVSWTPKVMFESSFYTPDECLAGEPCKSDEAHPVSKGDEFDFGSAIYLLKTGRKVARKGWNGTGMYVYYVPAASYPVERNNLETMGGEYPDNMVPYREYLALKTAQGDVATWAPSCSDALAEDWTLA